MFFLNLHLIVFKMSVISEYVGTFTAFYFTDVFLCVYTVCKYFFLFDLLRMLGQNVLDSN